MRRKQQRERGHEPEQASRFEDSGEGKRRGGIWTAAARECQMFKGDIHKMVL